jgi:hypothetical protein
MYKHIMYQLAKQAANITAYLPAFNTQWCRTRQPPQVCQAADNAQVPKLAINSKAGELCEPAQCC